MTATQAGPGTGRTYEPQAAGGHPYDDETEQWPDHDMYPIGNVDDTRRGRPMRAEARS